MKCGDGTPLVKHRRKTFIIGFITSALCAKKLAMDLMLKHEFQYFLIYKFCQDHLEPLFACIRGKNGFNNNPDLRTFKSAWKRILLRNSIIASRHGNCVMFEEEACAPVFSFKWSKNRTPLRQPESDMSDEGEKELSTYLITQESTFSPYKDAIIAYVGGYIIRSLMKSISCPTCYQAAVTNKKNVDLDHIFISMKDRGGLLYPSRDVLKILKICETVFKGYVSGDNFLEPKIKEKCNLKLKIKK